MLYTDTKVSIVLDKTYVTTGLGGIAENQLARSIDKLRIKSGKYRIQIKTIETFPQLLNTKVRFNIYYIRPPIL